MWLTLAVRIRLVMHHRRQHNLTGRETENKYKILIFENVEEKICAILTKPTII